MTKPTFNFFSGDKNLGVIFSEQNEIIVRFTEANVALTGTGGRASYNLMGKTRIIIIQGAHDGTGFTGATKEARIQDFIYTMEHDWINTAIQTSQYYYNSFNQPFKVDAVDWMWVRSSKDPGRILYTILMKETL